MSEPSEDIIVVKVKDKPWWPAQILNPEFSIADSLKCVKLFGFDDIEMVDDSSIISRSSRTEFVETLHELQLLTGLSKYDQYVPSDLSDLYDDAWEMAESIIPTKITRKSLNNFYDVPHCEICLEKYIDMEGSRRNRNLIKMSRKARIEFFMTSGIKNQPKLCRRGCKWKYHSTCIVDENNKLCICNKTIQRCNICRKEIYGFENASNNYLFACNVNDCKRTYHTSCISDYLKLMPSNLFAMNKVIPCPLHYCINCLSDNLLPKNHEPDSNILFCIKCKLGFHKNKDCLPMYYIPISNNMIICARHFFSTKHLSQKRTGFCFTCCSVIEDDNWITCQFCMVTYHGDFPCRPRYIPVTGDKYFSCNNCKFPFTYRKSSPILALPTNIEQMDSVYMWQLGQIIECRPSMEPDEFEDGIIQFKQIQPIPAKNTQENSLYTARFYKVIPINVRSLNTIMCFGLLRFALVQNGIKKAAEIACLMRETYDLNKSNRGNSFVLYFEGLFPIQENIYRVPVEKIPTTDYRNTVCKCLEKCTLTNPKCNNRQMHIKASDSDIMFNPSAKDPYLYSKHPFMKDNYVMEYVGEIRNKSLPTDTNIASEVSKESENKNEEYPEFVISTNGETVLASHPYCGLSRFLIHSEKYFNVEPKLLTIGSFSRIGLFATRNIKPCERLKINMLHMHKLVQVSSSSISLPTEASYSSLCSALKEWSFLGSNKAIVKKSTKNIVVSKENVPDQKVAGNKRKLSPAPSNDTSAISDAEAKRRLLEGLDDDDDDDDDEEEEKEKEIVIELDSDDDDDDGDKDKDKPEPQNVSKAVVSKEAIAKKNPPTQLFSRPILCPLCLKDLPSQNQTNIVLEFIHCCNCFATHHRLCAITRVMSDLNLKEKTPKQRNRKTIKKVDNSKLIDPNKEKISNALAEFICSACLKII